MTAERWGEILDKVLANFKVLEHTKDEEGISKIETLVFIGPLGKIKLVRTIRPAVIDKKVIGAHRKSRSKAQYEYIYSDTDTVSRVDAYKEVDNEWKEINPNAFN